MPVNLTAYTPATPERETVRPNRDVTIGKTKEAIRQCAGQSIREAVQNQSVLFLYYTEAPMLKASFHGIERKISTTSSWLQGECAAGR